MQTIDLEKFSYEELIELNRRIVERIKQMRTMRDAYNMMEFTKGDTVSFVSNGQTLIGRIVRLNKKTVSVDCKDGSQWKVSPSFLKKIANSVGVSDVIDV